MATPYLTTIGLEVHVQLRTRSKMFCSCPVEFGAGPNAHTCPVCLGLPGALPVINARAVEMTALTGLMLGCRISPVSKWDRKNYFYPDMPKNYQISQYDLPLCVGGAVPLPDYAYPKDVQKNFTAGGKQIDLVRIHLEEDVAKSFHFGTSTGIDFNRAGTPLMEIVSEPQIDSPEEAFAFLTSLRQILVYGGVSDADMEKGQLRCDCNVSVRPAGQAEFGTKIEIKNMNSISGVRRALAFEIRRQGVACERGEALQQETRRWDDASGETYLMRTKESAHDYRYFPDPDLLPVRTEGIIALVREQLPELPAAKRERFVEQYSVSPYDAGVLASDLALAQYFEAAARNAARPKTVANWILNDLLNALGMSNSTIEDCTVLPEALAELLLLVENGKINQGQAKEVFAEMFKQGRGAAEIVAEKGMEQESNTGTIEQLCDQVITAHPKVVADYKAGKTASINFLKGQVMKLSGGKANPAIASGVLARKLVDA